VIRNSFGAGFPSYGSTGGRDTSSIMHGSGKHACCCCVVASTSHEEALLRQLREDPKLAAEYLRAALEDTDEPRVLLIALRRVAEARGGIAKVAKAAGVERESLYRALSPNGNPRLSTLAAVARAMGLKLTVEAA